MMLSKLEIGIALAVLVPVLYVVLMIGYGMGAAHIRQQVNRLTEQTKDRAARGDIGASLELPGMTRMRALLRTWGQVVTVLLCAALLLGCDDDATSKRIYATCAQRMTLAHDGHDSLAVLLACDQMKLLAGVQQSSNSSAVGVGVAIGVSSATAGASAARSR